MKNNTTLHQQSIEMLLKHWSNYANLKKSHFNWLLNNSTYHQLARDGVLYEQGSQDHMPVLKSVSCQPSYSGTIGNHTTGR